MRQIAIRTRIILGFATTFALLVVISALHYAGSESVNRTIHEVVKERQPRALAIKTASAALQNAASQLGFFSATAEPGLSAAFSERLAEVRQRLLDYREQTDPSDPGLPVLDRILSQLEQFEQLGNRIIRLSADREANFPGIAYANDKINPISLDLTQQAGGILRFEVSDGLADDNQAKRLGTYSDLRDALSNIMRGVRGYLAFRTEGQRDNTLTFLTRAEQLVATIDTWADNLTFEQEEYLSALNQGLKALRPAIERMFEIHGSDKWRTDSWLLQNELLPLLRAIDSRLDELVSLQEQSIIDASDRLLRDAEAATRWSLWITALGLLLGTIIAWLITHSISVPLRASSKAMAQVADGEGDLTQRLSVVGRDEISRLAHNFNRFIASVESIVGETSKTTSSVIVGVASTNDNTGRIADRILSQQSETDQVATAVTEMLASIAEVAENAAEADRAAHQTSEEAKRGQRTVIDTADGIQTLAERLVGASQLVDRLETDAQSIRGVVDVIRGITEQINLLALNAAIEAARAGEHGRGFAVVAEEVRSLATRTHQSTAEIEEMVSRLDDSAGEAVRLMASGREMAESNAGQAQYAMTALSAIEASVATITGLNGQIAVAVAEQRTVVEDIHRSIEHISEAGLQNADEAADTRHAAAQLGDTIADLQSLVGRFRIRSAGFDFGKARNAHLSWRVRVRAFLDGEGSLSASEVVSHRECELGKWFYGEGLDEYGQLPEFRAIEDPHQRLHAMIREIVELKHSNMERQAEARFVELDEMSKAILQHLDTLEGSLGSTSEPHAV